MRYKNPELMNKICEFVEKCYFGHSYIPSCSEIGNEMGVSKNTIHRYLVSMDEKEIISYKNGVIETPKMKMISSTVNHAGIIGSVPCGPLSEMEESVEEYVPLPVSIFGDGDKFILHAVGDSMIGAGIDDGDLVVVRKQNTAKEGDIVVALSENGNTLKTLLADEENGTYILHPENPDMDDIRVKDLSIQGIAEYVIKKL